MGQHHRWIGQAFPSFSMKNEDDETFDESRLKGGWSVIFFYPKDRSLGCSIQAQTFVDLEDEFKKHGAQILGVSSDNVREHKAFKCDLGGSLSLLSDHKGVLRRSMNLGATLGIIPSRVTFVVDPEGIIQWVYKSQLRVKYHVHASLNFLASAQ